VTVEPLFVTERLAVRVKRPDDAEALHAIYADPEAMRPPFTTLGESRDFVLQHIRHQDAHGFSMWSAEERATGAVVGEVGFLAFAGGVEIGWRVRRSEWGRGLGTEMARAALAHGRDRLHLGEVRAFIDLDNTRSIRIAEKLGMRRVAKEASQGVPSWAEYTSG
jgi:RimJ/RimL family protein N-acetyltransferase